MVSDVVCPWCFVGKRQLERAVSLWQNAHPGEPAPVVVWHPFQLNPDLPVEGIARSEYLERKFGHADTTRLFQNVRRAAAAVGLELRLEAIARQTNTLRPHALLSLAADSGQQNALAEALFEAYFQQGKDLTDSEVLRSIALAQGLPPLAIEQALESAELLQEVAQADQQARDAGISGVPFFIVNRAVAVSGAQGADALLAAFEQALA